MEKLCNISTQQTEVTKLLHLSYCHIGFRDPDFEKMVNQRAIDPFEMWEDTKNYHKVINLRYFGHISRRTNGLEKIIVEEKINGKRPRGMSPTRWMNQTYQKLKISLVTICRKFILRLKTESDGEIRSEQLRHDVTILSLK